MLCDAMSHNSVMNVTQGPREMGDHKGMEINTPLEHIVSAVRAMAEATPNPCEGSRGHLRDEFAWEAEDDLRRLNTGERVDFTADDLHYDCLVALRAWAEQDLRAMDVAAATPLDARREARVREANEDA